MPDAADWLDAVHWEAGAYRTFACDSPQEKEVGWVEVNVHQFASPAMAQQAVDYFATARSKGTRLVSGGTMRLGDYSVMLAGPASNGSEVTVYLAEGPYLIRVTGVSRDGIPFMNVIAIAQAQLALAQ